MATPTIREVVQASESGGNATTVTSSGVEAGDVLVCFHVSNYSVADNMGPPAGTGAGTWELLTSADLGENVPHMKVWMRDVTTGGVQTTTVSPDVGEEVYQFVYVLSGVDAVDGADGTTTGEGVLAVCPSVDATGTDDLLLVAYYCDQSEVDFTAPVGMSGALEEEAAGFGTLGTAWEVLSASGATGTRTATANHDRNGFVGCTVALKGASAGGVDGDLNGSLPALTGSLSATVRDLGTLAGSLPALTGSVSGTSATGGDLSGTLPALTGAFAGDVQDQGTLAGDLPPLGGTVTGEVLDAVTLTGALPVMAGDVSATVTDPGTVDAALPALTGDLSGTITNPATMAGALPALTGSLSSTTPDEATLAGTLPALTGALAAELVAAATLAGTLPALKGAFTGGVPGVAEAIRVEISGPAVADLVSGPVLKVGAELSGPAAKLAVSGPAVRREVDGVGV